MKSEVLPYRGACITTIIFFILGNVMYAMLYAFQDQSSAYYMMITARFIVGVSSGEGARWLLGYDYDTRGHGGFWGMIMTPEGRLAFGV